MSGTEAVHPDTIEKGAIPKIASRARRLPELLAPAGDWECARAAVENGADAIYFGLEKFNARMRAHNFTEADLPELMSFLHKRGVKGYVTFNTLIFADELAEAEKCLRAIIAAGVDAAIVQDVGICRLIRQLSPDFPIHASTQMTITSAAGVKFARELGCNLVVLARECSLKEIEAIRAAQSGHDFERMKSNSSGYDHALASSVEMPIEVFVHGALCVAYSGQCLTSEALGGRSANRGECAQACRLPYDLICDGDAVPLGDRRYLLSPQDLAGIELLPEIVKAGVASLKIEGRLKSPEYVASITRVYRKALDALIEDPSTLDSHAIRYELEMSFSRGLYTGWFDGIDNQKLVHARFGKKRGVYLGKVTGLSRDSAILTLNASLKPGDGVVFDSGHPDEKEEGGRVYEIAPHKQNADNQPTDNIPSKKRHTEIPRAVELRFGRSDIDFSRIHIGDRVWKTSDPSLDRELQQTWTGTRPGHRRPIQFEVYGHPGAPITLLSRDDIGHTVKCSSSMPLVEARKHPLTTEKLRDQLGRLGETPFRLGALSNRLEGQVIVPVSELNRLRREIVQRLEELRSQPKQWTLTENATVLPPLEANRKSRRSGSVELIVLVRTLSQLQVAIECGVTTLYCEFEDPKKYRDAVTLVRSVRGDQSPHFPLSPSAPSIWVAPPRITKTGEEWILNQVRSSDADGYLIRNYDHLDYFSECRRVGDFSLNIANPLSAEYYAQRYGLERLTASYDLNVSQLEALLKSTSQGLFEITIHQHMPMFHMEHCVFCAFLSTGTDYRNCGRPCDRHDVQLRDRVGIQHPLKADAGCRNTVFNGRAQTGAEFVSRLIELGARHFRIEFLNETTEEVVRTITTYRQLLRGEISGQQVWKELKLFNQLGVTRGQIEGRRER